MEWIDCWDEAGWSPRHEAALKAFRSKGCWICGATSGGVGWHLTAHHIYPPDKKFCVAKCKCSDVGITAYLAELEKCACLCRHCHDKVHGFVDLDAPPGQSRERGVPGPVGPPYPPGLTRSQRRREQRKRAERRRKEKRRLQRVNGTLV